MAPRSVVLLIFVPVPLWGLAAVLVGLGVYATFVELTTALRAGSRMAHTSAGAALGALAVARVVVRRPRGVGQPGFFAGILRRARAMQQGRRQRGEAKRELQLDEILAKVKQQGLGSLRHRRAAVPRTAESAHASGRPNLKRWVTTG
jgi:hypothetical protein